MMGGASDCEFCLRLVQPVGDRPWYDFHTLEVTPNFATVVALGPLAPGHIMIVTRRHVERMADLDSSCLEELELAVSSWVARLRRIWPFPCFIFEHGGRSVGNSGGSCIAHAHLQMLPLAVELLLDYDSFNALPSLLAVSDCRSGSDYLLVWTETGLLVAMDRSEPGQFFRRRIAGALGRPDDWDYLVFPNYHAMRETIDRLV
jgi:diadenosine tetraphosphate (Ap4A) HIT family hydrolase